MEEIAQPEPHKTSMSSTRSILSIRDLERNLEPEELKLCLNQNTSNAFLSPSVMDIGRADPLDKQ